MMTGGRFLALRLLNPCYNRTNNTDSAERPLGGGAEGVHGLDQEATGHRSSPL